MTRDTKAAVDPTPESALDAIYREHFAFVWSVLRRLGIAEADLDDASQDVFVVAHRRLGQFEGRAAVRTWLYSIALRVASNRRRKHARRDALLVRLPTVVPDDLEELAANGQARAILESLLDRLDEPKRVVFVLADLEELTVPAIAELVGENPRTIYSRLRAARARVATELAGLHGPRPIDLDAAIGAARPRPTVEPERARRAWAAVLVRLGEGGVASTVAATGTLAKIAIAVGLVGAAVTTAVLVVPERGPDAPPAVAAPATAAPARTSPAAPPTPAAQAPAIVAAPVAVPAASPARRPAPAPDDPLRDEIAVLDRARDHLANARPESAITELDAYDARFAGGRLRREADGVRVLALCRLGRTDAATEFARTAGLPPPRCAPP